MSEYVTTADIAAELWGAAEVAAHMNAGEDFVKLLILPRIDFPRPLRSSSRGRQPKRRWSGESVKAWWASEAKERVRRLYFREREETKTAPLQAPLFTEMPRVPTVKLSAKERDPMAHFMRSAMRQARRRATKNRREIDISFEVLAQMLAAQRGRCAVSGMQFSLDRIGSSLVRPFAPSIDRINSRSGYVAGNVRLVCHCINLMMNEWGDAVFHELARYIKEPT